VDDLIHRIIEFLILSSHIQIEIDFNQLISQYGYVAFIFISFIGSVTIFVQIPYLSIIYFAGSTQRFNPVFLGISSGIGATIGELTLYLLFRGGRYVLSDKRKRKLEALRLLIDKYGAWLIFILAVTPIPDDIIYPSLGIMRFSLTKIFVAAFLGKTILSTFVAFAGFYSYEAVKSYLGGEDPVILLIVFILSILFTVVILMIDWEKYLVENVDEESASKR